MAAKKRRGRKKEVGAACGPAGNQPRAMTHYFPEGMSLIT